MSVIRRYENELSAKVKQKDMFELLKDWVTNDFKKPENSKFSEHLIKSGIYAAKTDTGYVSVRTIHVGNTVSPYEDNYLFDTKIVYEDRNLFINEKGYLLYDKDNNNWQEEKRRMRFDIHIDIKSGDRLRCVFKRAKAGRDEQGKCTEHSFWRKGRKRLRYA